MTRLTSYYKTLFSLLLIFILSACATGLNVNTRQHAQDVFQKHNQLVSEIILISSDATLTDAQLLELEAAEALMINACEPLNSVAAEVRDGGKPSVGQSVNILRSLKQCEQETITVQKLMLKFKSLFG